MWTIGRKILRHRSYPTNAIVLTQRQYNIPKKNHLNKKLQSDSQSVGAILKRRQKYLTSYILFFEFGLKAAKHRAVGVTQRRQKSGSVQARFRLSTLPNGIKNDPYRSFPTAEISQ